MQELLTNKLHQYISENNPDLLLSLEEENKTSSFLTDKVNGINHLIKQLKEAHTPQYITEEVCMETLTKELRPSRFNYIKDILEEEFEYCFL